MHSIRKPDRAPRLMARKPRRRMSPPALEAKDKGAVAQLGERLLCKQDVVGSIPSGSTIIHLEKPSLRTASSCSPVLHDIVKRRFVRGPQTWTRSALPSP
jgi:hypothetical protein